MGGHFPLEGDGCVPALFHYMWNKNSRKKSCPMVKLPDTVVYKYRQPAYWYFTSKDPSAGIKMKNKCSCPPLPERLYSQKRRGCSERSPSSSLWLQDPPVPR